MKNDFLQKIFFEILKKLFCQKIFKNSKKLFFTTKIEKNDFAKNFSEILKI